MNDLDTISGIWRRNGLGVAAADPVALVRCATLAASSHNTQPWRFGLERDSVVILPDLSRRCPVVDPDDHHLYCSIGCATENLVLAARAAGLGGEAIVSGSGVRVDLTASAPERSPWFDAIPMRQTSRVEFDGTELAPGELNALERAGRGDGVSVLLLTSREQKDQVAAYVAAGNTAQFGDPRWTSEMREWIRFNQREARRRGDGLSGAALGIPNVPRWFGERVMSIAATAASQNRKDARHIRSSGAIAVLFSERDDPRSWIEAGRCCQRLALEATARGLRSAFLNQPIEVPALRPQFAAFLGIGSRRPDLVLRIGRGPDAPRSLRRPLDEVLLRPDPRRAGSAGPTARVSSTAGSDA